MSSYSSQLLMNAVDAFATFPGIGRKTALRLAMHLINQDKTMMSQKVIAPLQSLIDRIRFCQKCHNISDHDICTICSQRGPKSSTICVVESIRDVMAIEDTGQYNGTYHVLGGVISPLDGVAADDLYISDLMDRVQHDNIQEVILAISPTIEGETTIYYISKNLQDYDVQISQLARGISFGGELEYADELTLGRSIATRTPYRMSQL